MEAGDFIAFRGDDGDGWYFRVSPRNSPKKLVANETGISVTTVDRWDEPLEITIVWSPESMELIPMSEQTYRVTMTFDSDTQKALDSLRHENELLKQKLQLQQKLELQQRDSRRHLNRLDLPR